MTVGSFTGSLFFLSLLGYALAWMLVVPGLTLGRALLSALCSMLLAAYWGVILLEWMVPTAYGLLYGGLGCLVAGLALAAAGKRQLRQRLHTVSLWGFLALSVLLVALCSTFQVGAHDDFSFWARAAKELFTFDTSYFHGKATLSHKDYNPIFAALQYCIMRVFGWQDAFLCYVPAACLVVVVCALADFYQHKAYGCLFLLLGVLAYPVFGFRYEALTVDGPLSILFVGGLLTLAAREDCRMSSLLPGVLVIAVLPAVKIYAGLLFGLILLLYLLGITCKGERSPVASQERPLGRPPLGYGAAALCLLLLMQLSWSGYYHYQSRQEAYHREVNRFAYRGETLPDTLQPPAFQLRDLFAGNPRTGALGEALSQEAFAQVGERIGETWEMYIQSKLPVALVFALALGCMVFLQRGSLGRQAGAVLLWLLAAFVLYTLGLFAGYFVQGEISSGAIRYLQTVSLPLVLAALFYGVLLAQSRRGPWGMALHGALLATVVYMLFGGESLQAIRPQQEADVYPTFATHAQLFFEEEAAPYLSPADAGKVALLMDCTWDATEIKSKSGITHAYQYAGLPLRVHVYQYPYWDDSLLDAVTAEWLASAALENCAELLLLRVEDDLYAEAFAEALQLEETPYSPSVFDIRVEEGQPTFHLRQEAEPT